MNKIISAIVCFCCLSLISNLAVADKPEWANPEWVGKKQVKWVESKQAEHEARKIEKKAWKEIRKAERQVKKAAQTISGVQRLEEGIATYEHGEYDDAIFKLEMALDQISNEDNESLWKTYFYLGLTYHLTGVNDEAREQFSKAQGISKNRLPDPDIHSPKVLTLFKDSLEPAGPDIEMVFIKGGCFRMGDNFRDGYNNEKPVHKVCVDGFYMGTHEVTQVQWEEIMGNNPSGYKKGRNYPVSMVSWNDVQEYIYKLNNITGKKYRLPTEAEWEYAARSGGKREKFAGTSKESKLDRYAWYGDNSKDKTHPVGQKKPNRLGLYDMSGSVWEWCQDWYGKDYYRSSPKNNPKGPSSGSHRVNRGGSRINGSWYLRGSLRYYFPQDLRFVILGFRLARTVD
jgi:formylglycine-generating enzyme